MTNDRFFAKIRAELAKPPGRRRLTPVQVEGLLQLAEQAERLRPYVRHRPDCKVTTILEYGAGVEGGCSCGLATAQAPSGRGPGEVRAPLRQQQPD